ncbi:hypothetical protein [Spartinivicinus ruber]|uniref:hypothetical protein n=1 Tax=Spartinivicinus ruber TaxID=2683272 RepID=UPI0013D82445|nr:hypothetical protein [Spartinivicinus ruber]
MSAEAIAQQVEAKLEERGKQRKPIQNISRLVIVNRSILLKWYIRPRKQAKHLVNALGYTTSVSLIK